MIPDISIDPAFKKLCPDIKLGILAAKIKTAPRSADLNTLIAEGLKEQAERLGDTAAIKELPVIQATRLAYKSLGKDPSRYRPSSEALLRRTVQGKGLYEVSNAVDALNLVSVKTGFSIGGYDLEKINGPITLRRGATEPYEAIGRGGLNIEGLPVLFDLSGPFGSPTSDSVRTSVSDLTCHFLMVFFDFDGKGPLEAALSDTQMIFENYVYGSDFETLVH